MTSRKILKNQQRQCQYTINEIKGNQSILDIFTQYFFMHTISQGPRRHQKSSGRFGTNFGASLFQNLVSRCQLSSSVLSTAFNSLVAGLTSLKMWSTKSAKKRHLCASISTHSVHNLFKYLPLMALKPFSNAMLEF